LAEAVAVTCLMLVFRGDTAMVGCVPPGTSRCPVPEYAEEIMGPLEEASATD